MKIPTVSKSIRNNLTAYIRFFGISYLISLTLSVAAFAQLTPVDLGTAGDFLILGESGITNTGSTSITGDIGVSPAAHTTITGFSLTGNPATDEFLTSAFVTGRVYAADLAVPTPAKMTEAVNDMLTAYNDAAGRPDAGALVSEIGGQTLTPGLYANAGVVTINSDVTLNGGPNDVFIFQIAGGITQAANTNIILTGGVLAENIFWQSAGVVAIGAGAHFEGIVLSAVTISLDSDASVNGRLLSQTNVTLIENDIHLLPSLSTDSCFRMLTTAAAGDSYDDLLANVHTQGAGVISGKSNHFSFGEPNVWLWPDVDGDDQSGWEVLTDLTATIPAGTGFLLSKFEQNVFNDPDSEGPVALSVNSGSEYSGDISPPLNSNPDGWTLVGNPYYSAIDFNALTTSNLTDVAYIFDHSVLPDGDWVSTDGSFGDIPGGVIHSFQGFFVQNDGGGAYGLKKLRDKKK